MAVWKNLNDGDDWIRVCPSPLIKRTIPNMSRKGKGLIVRVSPALCFVQSPRVSVFTRRFLFFRFVSLTPCKARARACARFWSNDGRQYLSSFQFILLCIRSIFNKQRAAVREHLRQYRSVPYRWQYVQNYIPTYRCVEFRWKT